jgi:hypothetical protein
MSNRMAEFLAPLRAVSPAKSNGVPFLGCLPTIIILDRLAECYHYAPWIMFALISCNFYAKNKVLGKFY